MLKKFNFWLIASIVILAAAVIVLSLWPDNPHFRWSVYGCCVLGLIPANILLYRSCIKGADMLFPALPFGFFVSFLSPILHDVFSFPECSRFIALLVVVIAYSIILIKLRKRFHDKVMRKLFGLEK